MHDTKKYVPKKFCPRSKLVTKTTLVNTPRFPVVDAHNHLADLFRRARSLGLTTSLDTNYDPSETWFGFDELLSTLGKSLQLAAICGALSTQSAGGTMAQPTLEEAEIFLK